MEIINTKNKTVTMTTDCMKIKSIIKGFYKQLYANKFDNLDETNSFKDTMY